MFKNPGPDALAASTWCRERRPAHGRGRRAWACPLAETSAALARMSESSERRTTGPLSARVLRSGSLRTRLRRSAPAAAGRRGHSATGAPWSRAISSSVTSRPTMCLKGYELVDLAQLHRLILVVDPGRSAGPRQSCLAPSSTGRLKPSSVVHIRPPGSSGRSPRTQRATSAAWSAVPSVQMTSGE